MREEAQREELLRQFMERFGSFVKGSSLSLDELEWLANGPGAKAIYDCFVAMVKMEVAESMEKPSVPPVASDKKPVVYLADEHFPESKFPRITIQFGGKTFGELMAALDKVNCQLSREALEMLGFCDLAPRALPEEATLVRVKVKDLFGDEKSRSLSEIYSRAISRGLNLCPPGIVLCLLLERKLPLCSIVATEPIIMGSGQFRLFCGTVHNGLVEELPCLSSCIGNSDVKFICGNEFFFHLYRTTAWRVCT